MSGAVPDGRATRALPAAAMAAAIVAAACAGGCATITSGSSQTLAIDTYPAAAACTLSRAGETIAFVNPTPGSVSISKSRKDISIVCKKDGFADAQATLSSSVAGATFGNIILGGLIGVGVDAMSGATSKYDTAVSLSLIPSQFSSTGERDAYFEKLKDHVRQQSEARRTQLTKDCATGSCEKQLKSIDAQETTALAKLDSEEQQVTVAAPQ